MTAVRPHIEVLRLDGMWSFHYYTRFLKTHFQYCPRFNATGSSGELPRPEQHKVCESLLSTIKSYAKCWSLTHSLREYLSYEWRI